MWLLVIQNAAAAMSVILGKEALRYASPLFYIGSRMSIGGLILLVCYYALYRTISIKKENIALLVQVMFFQFYLTYICDIYAISHLTTARISMLYALTPFIAALFSYWIFNERVTIKKAAGMIIGFIGIMLIATVGKIQGHGNSIVSLAGALLSLGVVCNAYGSIILRVLVRERRCSPLLITALAMFGAGVCSLITAYLFEPKHVIAPVNIQMFMLILLAVVVFGNIVAHGLNGFLLKKYTATFMALAGFLYPIFGAFFGWLFFGESVTYVFFASVCMIAAGIYIFYHEELRLGYYL